MFKCKLCNHNISYENLIDSEWGCGQCTMDDWERTEPPMHYNKEQKEQWYIEYNKKNNK